MNVELLEKAFTTIEKKWPDARPRCGIILGSGWGEVADGFEVRDIMPYEKIPGLGAPGVAGHSGRLVWCRYAGLETLIFQGRRHWYEGEGWTPVALPVYVMKKLGVSQLLLTNAAGGIRAEFKPGDMMVIDDHINHMDSNPLVGGYHPFWGPRFPDQTQVYDTYYRGLLDAAAGKLKLRLAHGIYLAATGPIYETPAEIRMFRTMGADAVGMSTVPEATLAHAAGMDVVGLSCITNLAAGISKGQLTHDEVTSTANLVMPNMKALILQFWQDMAGR